jgi:hypothetical protein
LSATSTPDFRTRLLVRDCARAIRSFWGKRRFERWLNASRVGDRIRTILAEDLGKPGFRYIRRRLVANPTRADIEQALELLGGRIHGRVEISIAGSIPTLIAGLTARPTDDIDIVTEVPSEIRGQREALRRIKSDYRLTLGHVQSHDLPSGWESRRHLLGDFGGIRAYLVDPYDIFVRKLSSRQEKHQQDLRVIAKSLDRESMRHRLFTAGKAFLDEPRLRAQIERLAVHLPRVIRLGGNSMISARVA